MNRPRVVVVLGSRGQLDAAGLSAREIADQLGHSKPSLTQDVYMGRKAASTRAAEVFESLG